MSDAEEALPRTKFEELLINNQVQMAVKIEHLDNTVTARTEAEQRMRAEFNEHMNRLSTEMTDVKTSGRWAGWLAKAMLPFIIGAAIHGIVMWVTVNRMSDAVEHHIASPGHPHEQRERASNVSRLDREDAVLNERQRALAGRVDENERDISSLKQRQPRRTRR